jgi:membrane-associated phospholipid phosphatase
MCGVISLRRPVLIAALVCIFAESHAATSSPADPNEHPPGVLGRLGGFTADFAIHLLRDYQTQLQFPFQYVGEHPGRAMLASAGLAGLVLSDRATYDALAPKEIRDKDELSDAAARMSKWGNSSSTIPLVLGIGAAGIVFDSPRERETSLMLVEAILTSATWTELLKTATGRERPREAEGVVSDWTGPGGVFGDDGNEGVVYRSFPSGHSTGIWATATVLAHQYPEHGVVPVLAYGTAVAMGYSRMITGAHWLSDVVVGGLIGYGCARQVLSAHESRRRAENPPQLGVSLEIENGYKGVALSYRF